MLLEELSGFECAVISSVIRNVFNANFTLQIHIAEILILYNMLLRKSREYRQLLRYGITSVNWHFLGLIGMISPLQLKAYV